MNRRQHPRIKLPLTGYVVEMEQYDPSKPWSFFTEIDTLDISDRGLHFKTKVHFPINSFLCIMLVFKGKKSLFFGMVRWKKVDNRVNEYGIFFNAWAYLDPLLEKSLMQHRSFANAFKLRHWFRKTKEPTSTNKSAWGVI